MSGTRKHMSDTCFQQPDGCILTQVVARWTTKNLRMRKTVKTVLMKFSQVIYVVTMTRHMFVCLAHVNTCLTQTWTPKFWEASRSSRIGALWKIFTQARKTVTCSTCPARIKCTQDKPTQRKRNYSPLHTVSMAPYNRPPCLSWCTEQTKPLESAKTVKTVLLNFHMSNMWLRWPDTCLYVWHT